MRKLRVGVIGVGHLGHHHARLYASLPGATLVGVTDLDPQRAQSVADRYNTKAFADANALLNQVDAVSVAVPTSAHHAVVKDCLNAGAHVLVEKPIAVTQAEAADLVKVARKQRRALQVGHIERFNPVIRSIRPYIKKPAFIECHRLSLFGERGTDVDVVLDLMIHDLDMILSFDPGPVEEVRAAGVPVLSSAVDIANARIAFGSGCVANLTASRVSMARMRKLYISVDYQAKQGAIFRRRLGRAGKPEIEMEQVPIADEEPLKLELESFVQAAVTGKRPDVSGEDGEAALKLAHQVLGAIEMFVKRHTVE
jgi:predicted dehydrogenase